MRRRTKIVCTMGPAVATMERILQLIDAGMNVARLNFSHGTHADHAKMISMLKEARAKRKMPLALMLDTKGPEIRLGKMKEGGVTLEAGQRILLVSEEVTGDEKRWSIMPPQVMKSLKAGTRILFSDGYIGAHVVQVKKEGVVVELENGGKLTSFQGVNIPGVEVPLPLLTEQDRKDILFGCDNDVDIIAASFVRTPAEVVEIKKLCAKSKKSEILVLAKIENSSGVAHFDAILEAADGIMVARGDLGVEMPLREVPTLQKMMIRKTVMNRKPVVTATQMLESMIKNPRPTRAEVSDIANAIYDSTSAVMLSGETAMGSYPVQAVEMMHSVIEEAERHFPYALSPEKDGLSDDISHAVAWAAVKTAYATEAKAIFAFTSRGFTAKLVSSFRPEVPIIALPGDLKTYHQLALSWGVIPIEPAKVKNSEDAYQACKTAALREKLVKKGDTVVVTAGIPFGVAGTTNTLSVEKVD